MATKQELLKKVLGEIKDKVNDKMLVDFSDSSCQEEILCSWGSILVDQIAPLCRSKLYEVYGKESSGKSSLAISACANVIKNGGIAAYFDVECAFNLGFANALGLDIKNPNFLLFQPDTEEDALVAMLKLVKSGIVDICVLDSTNALVPKASILEQGDSSDELSEQRVGLRAKILSNGLSQLIPAMRNSKTTCVFISQLRDNISMFGGNDVIGSGRALGFFSSVRISVNSIGKIEGDLSDGTKGIIAIPVRIKTTKNKIIAPFKTVEIQINVEGDNKGICLESEYTQAAFNMGFLIKDNRGILFKEENPLYPEDTPLASSMPKLNEIFGEVKDNKDHPYYWIKKEIELRVQEKLNLVTAEEIDNILGPIYEQKEKENEYAQKYFELANSASSSSKLMEANYYIIQANKYSPFDKAISQKYKAITKRFNDKLHTFKKLVCELHEVETNKDFTYDYETEEKFYKESENELNEQ